MIPCLKKRDDAAVSADATYGNSTPTPAANDVAAANDLYGKDADD